VVKVSNEFAVPYSIAVTTRLSLPHPSVTHVRQDVGIFKGAPRYDPGGGGSEIPAHTFTMRMVEAETQAADRQTKCDLTSTGPTQG
jgi:hypothetical protein